MSMYVKSVLIVTLVFFVQPVASQTAAVQIHGTTGSDPAGESSWLDLNVPTSFMAGDTLSLTVTGSEMVIIRLLPQGISADQLVGVVGGPRVVPASNIVEIELQEDHPDVVQISVHGGSQAWNCFFTHTNGSPLLRVVELFRAQNDGRPRATRTRWQTLMGTTESSARWYSSWLDLPVPLDFESGDVVRLTLCGAAERVLVRLLPISASPGSDAGMIWRAYEIATDRTVEITLRQDHPQVKQISVHGGPEPFDFDLGQDNGPVTILCVERLIR